ncbi:MAG: DUF87 domain-containing protein [Candidatus Eisenbacteria bacterium]
MIDETAAHLRRLLKGTEHDAARRWHAATERARDSDRHARREAFLRELSCRPNDNRVRLGRGQSLEGEHQWCGLPLDALCAMHVGVSGATGTGKSFLIAGLLFQLLMRRVPLVLVDMKSELAELLLEVIVPAVVARGREDLIDRVRIIRPFEPGRVPLLRLTEPEPRVSRQVQSMNIAQSLSEAVGHDLGPRMLRALLPAAGLAVERNLPLPILTEWLRSPEAFAKAAASSSDPIIRAYALHELPRENRNSLDALRARLDLLFHLPEVRAALSAPHCLSFDECLESGVTILDFGSPPGGAEAAMRFIAGPVAGRFGRAILSREMGPRTAPTVVCFEEFQELLGSYQVEMFKRLLALSRFKRVSLWFSNQQPAQIAEADRTLLRILRTNLGAEVIFRSSVEDARTLSGGLSTRSPDETLTQARSRLIEEIATLPRRSLFLWLRDSSFGPQRLQSPRLDVDALRRSAATLTPEVRERIRLGSTSIVWTQDEDSSPTERVTEPDERVAPLQPEKRRRAPRLG